MIQGSFGAPEVAAPVPPNLHVTSKEAMEYTRAEAAEQMAVPADVIRSVPGSLMPAFRPEESQGFGVRVSGLGFLDFLLIPLLKGEKDGRGVVDGEVVLPHLIIS